MPKQRPKITQRKLEHLKIFRDKDISFQKSNGFSNYRLRHTSLPELNLEEIDIATEFLGYELAMPFMISAITGGESEGRELNRNLAKIAAEKKVALALGSMRPCLENKERVKTFSIAKEIAPDTPVIANIGGQQLLDYELDLLAERLADIQVDGLAIHLNPLQEALQPEGDKNFVGIKEKIASAVEELSLPIIIKEVGFGLTARNIQELSLKGIDWFDIAGAGGTSWAMIEKYRTENLVDMAVADEFSDFGISTAELLQNSVGIKGVNIIASGGINRALDFAKAVAMGAKLCGSAGEILRQYNAKGIKGVKQMLDIFRKTLHIALFITGSKTLHDFQNNETIEKWLEI